MAVGEARPGYELWRPNRAKAASITTRLLAVLLLIVSIALMVIIVLGGWPVLLGGSTWGVITLFFGVVYALLALMIFRWSRGALSLTVALSVLLAILCGVGVESWFVRARDGFESGALPSDLLGVLMAIMIPLQLAVTVVCAVGFTQEWHVEEERPLPGIDPGAGGDPVAPEVEQPRRQIDPGTETSPA